MVSGGPAEGSGTYGDPRHRPGREDGLGRRIEWEGSVGRVVDDRVGERHPEQARAALVAVAQEFGPEAPLTKNRGRPMASANEIAARVDFKVLPVASPRAAKTMRQDHRGDPRLRVVKALCVLGSKHMSIGVPRADAAGAPASSASSGTPIRAPSARGRTAWRRPGDPTAPRGGVALSRRRWWPRPRTGPHPGQTWAGVPARRARSTTRRAHSRGRSPAHSRGRSPAWRATR